MKMLDLEKLPIDNYTEDIQKFLGITDAELTEASEEFVRRMKTVKDVWKDQCEEFGLKEALVMRTADNVIKRNMAWLMGRVDRQNPMALLGRLHEAPRDKPSWVLGMLRAHGFRQVELTVWVAADCFLSKLVERKTAQLVEATMGRLGL
jgi:hypothetical protein